MNKIEQERVLGQVNKLDKVYEPLLWSFAELNEKEEFDRALREYTAKVFGKGFSFCKAHHCTMRKVGKF